MWLRGNRPWTAALPCSGARVRGEKCGLVGTWSRRQVLWAVVLFWDRAWSSHSIFCPFIVPEGLSPASLSPPSGGPQVRGGVSYWLTGAGLVRPSGRALALPVRVPLSPHSAQSL